MDESVMSKVQQGLKKAFWVPEDRRPKSEVGGQPSRWTQAPSLIKKETSASIVSYKKSEVRGQKQYEDKG